MNKSHFYVRSLLKNGEPIAANDSLIADLMKVAQDLEEKRWGYNGLPIVEKAVRCNIPFLKWLNPLSIIAAIASLFQKRKAVFCSEFIAIVLQRVGLIPPTDKIWGFSFGTTPQDWIPGDFSESADRKLLQFMENSEP